MRILQVLLPEPSYFEVEIAIEKLESYGLLGIEKSWAELIQVGDSTLCSKTHKVINYVWNEEELS